MPRPASVALLVVAALSGGGLDAQTREADRLTTPFKAGGNAFLKLSAGGYRIAGADDDQIRIRWHTQDPDDMGSVRVEATVDGKDATIRTRGPMDNFEVTIELPRRTNLTVRLSAGELDVRDIQGSMDIDAWAGEINVRVGDAASYRRVHTSVTVGEIDALPFRISKGGFFRAFTADGKGPYDLRVKLFAGEVKIIR
jgi:hypothetical protein